VRNFSKSSIINHQSSILSVLLIALLLAACAEEPTITNQPTATATETVVASPTPLQTTPPVTTAAASPTPNVTVTGTPTTQPATAPATATATNRPLTATPSPVSAPTPTNPPATVNGATATPAATTTPLPNVPLQPVRRPGGNLTVAVLENELRGRNFSPYSGEINELSQHLQNLVWNARLVYQDPLRGDWRPLSARGLPTVDSDGKRYAFSLRDDLTWSDGVPITSADFIFALNTFNALPEGNKPARLAELLRIKTISGPDLRTLIFTFDEPFATAINTIALLEPLPSHIWRNLPLNDATRNPEIIRPTVTSGPFRPDATGQIFTPVPRFWLGRPNLERVNLRVARTASEISDNLQFGFANWTYHNLPVTLYETLMSNNNLTAYRWTPQDAARRYIGYNTANGFLSNKTVRQALNKIIDVRSLIAVVESGLATEQSGFLPAGNSFSSRNLPPPRFSIRQARDELRAAGFTIPDGGNALSDRQNKPVPGLRLIYLDGSMEMMRIAVYLRQQYQQAGLQLTLEKLDAATYQKRRAAGDFELDLGTIQQSGQTDPDYYKDQFITKGRLNFYGYSNPALDRLFADAVTRETVAGQRRNLYEQAQAIVADDAPLFFLYTLQEFTVMSSNFDTGGAGAIPVAQWNLTPWDSFPAYLNWYQSS
jgi:peptide/nickel transport system substrate-binding protein